MEKIKIQAMYINSNSVKKQVTLQGVDLTDTIEQLTSKLKVTFGIDDGVNLKVSIKTVIPVDSQTGKPYDAT